MRRTYLHLYVGCGELAALLLLLAVFIAVDWQTMDACFVPGAAGPRGGLGHDACYCEALSDGPVKQPVNTLSAFAFSLVGLLVLASIGFARPAGNNPMTRELLFPAVFGYLAIYLGPGAMYFHATFSALGGFLDSTSMYVFMSFVLVYQLLRLTRLPTWAAALIWVGLNALLFLLAFLINPTLVFALLCVGAGVVQILVFVRETLRHSAWFWAGLGCFAVALLIWGLSHTDAPLCTPDSIWQGHAVWHVLSAASVACFYLYMRTAPDLP
jgi:hypothetical protein